MKILTMVFIGVFIFISPFLMQIYHNVLEESQDIQGRCEGYGYLDSEYNCCNDCNKIDQKYFKYKYIDRGILSSDEYTCSCVLNGTITKIY